MRPALAALLLALPPGISLAETAPREVTGKVYYDQRVALPDTARLLLNFQDPDGASLGADGLDTAGKQVPIGFVTGVPAGTTQLETAIFLDTEPLWISGTVAVPPGEGAVTLPDIRLTAADAAGQSRSWTCGGQPVAVGIAGSLARMAIGGGIHDLAQVRTASGVKYQALGDAGIWAWEKGEDLTVSFGNDTGTPAPGATAATPATLTARGNEPGWRADVTGDTVRLRLQDGTDATLPVTAAGPVDGARRYSFGDGLVLEIRDGLCHDDMTGMPYPAAARLIRDGKSFQGCAGASFDLLAGPEWQVEDIGGAGIIDNSNVTLVFEDGRVAGSAGCNRFFAEVKMSGEALTFGPAGSTMMACAPALMDQERKFLATLAQVERFDIASDGALQLFADGKLAITARR